MIFVKLRNCFAFDLKKEVSDREDTPENSGSFNSNNHIYLNESLTLTNRNLLKEIKKTCKQLQCRFTLYAMNGQIRVKKMKKRNMLL